MKLDVSELSIGKQLRLKRMAEGIKQEELAKMLDIHVGTLNRVEHDRQTVPIKCQEEVMNYLNA